MNIYQEVFLAFIYRNIPLVKVGSILKNFNYNLLIYIISHDNTMLITSILCYHTVPDILYSTCTSNYHTLITLCYVFCCIQAQLKPIFFYINSIFALHGLLVCSLFALTWMLCGSWVAGLLTVAFYVINKYVSVLILVYMYIHDKKSRHGFVMGCML